MMKTIQRIPLKQIDLSDETFSVNYLPNLQTLRSSMKEVGLLQPLLLRQRSKGYQVVCGFRRVLVMRDLGRSEVEARVFEENEMGEFQFFSLSLYENIATRGFNAVEKAIALEKLVHRFQIPPDQVIQTFLPLFSLEPHEKILNTYLSLAQMEDEIKAYVVKEEVSRFNIRKWALFPPEDRIAILSLISRLKLSENRLREILTLLEEISRRNGKTARELVRRPEIQSILSQKELTSSQKTERVKEILRGLRYPRMHQLEEGFERKKKSFNLPPQVILHPPPFFEGKGLKIQFQFETMKEYQAILGYLSDLGDKEEFQEMLESL